ncbi:MAG TPA: hypothetical protein VN241_13390 [Microbacterium sp.]|nr:hypothetical protein [Microbacterium sp.]
MNTTSSARSRAGSVATLAMAALLILTGCAGGSPTGDRGPSGNGGDASPSAVAPDAGAYAECMRDNGIPGFPDPDSSGEFAVDASKLGVPMDSEQYKQAAQTCEPLMPERTDDQQQQDYQAALEYAECMRDEGLPGFPDPPAPGSGSGTQGDSSGGSQSGPGFDPESPQFQAAHDSCKDLLPDGAEGPGLSEDS